MNILAMSGVVVPGCTIMPSGGAPGGVAGGRRGTVVTGKGYGISGYSRSTIRHYSE